MADPISITASVVGLISVGIKATQSLVEFYNSYKHQDSEIAGMTERLESLLSVLQNLDKILSNRKFQADEQSLIGNIENSIKTCDELIQGLQEECQKFVKSTSGGIKAVLRAAGRRATYPFRQSTLQKLDEDIGELHNNLSLAIDVLQLKDSKRTQDDIADLKLLLDLVRTRQISATIRDWLKAPDATVNHNAACEKKHPGTGNWFVNSPLFTAWLKEENSFLWLSGFAGSGKSVLSSTILQFAFRHRKSNPQIGIAFFYFAFNDESKQDESAMLRALLMQLSGQLEDGHLDLTRLYESYKTGIPPSSALTDSLWRLIQRFRHVCIVLDALDESPRLGARQHVLDTIEVMQKWGLPGLHLLVTSRDEPDIRNSLDFSLGQEVKMRNSGIDKDITDFISTRLQQDKKLRKWLPHSDKIQKTLAERAQGVFRWVECQFKSLQACPRSEDHLDRLLNSLPQSLDETYERMLRNIDKTCIEDARRILTLLCFSARPLMVPELIEAIAVDIHSARLNPKRRLQNVYDILDICIGLVDIDYSTSDPTTSHDQRIRTPIVRIAHFSVQEYLKSERIRNQKDPTFSLIAVEAHQEIAQIFLVYMLEPGLTVTELDQYPLAEFAACFWYHHYKRTEYLASKLDNLILQFFKCQRELFVHLMHFLWWGDGAEALYLRYNPKTAQSPVDCASLLGLRWVLEEFISAEREKDSKRYILPPTSLFGGADINSQDGNYANALQAAAYGGHEDIVKLLVEVGADVNAQCGYYGNALQVASLQGHKSSVQLLIEKGADIHAQSGFFRNALQAASSGGHENIVQLLIEKGSDVNVQGGHYGNALQAASNGGNENIVQLLIEKGADFHSQGGFYGNALQAASHHGHENIVQLLIEKGTDIHAQCGIHGNALQAASLGDHENIVQLLIEKGADVNAQCGEWGNALQAASHGGNENIIQLLIEKGANVNAQGGEWGNALQAASLGGHENMVQLLIEKGADIHAQGGFYGNALQAASDGGNENIVQLLIEKGADIHAQGGFYGNALQAASQEGHENIIQLLIEKGEDVNAQCGKYGNALQAASDGGNENIVQLLIEKGADIHAQGGFYGNALQAASYQGHKNIVQLLIKKGADVNAQGGKHGNALQAASCRGRKNIVQLLIEKGADIHAQGGEYCNSLQAASASYQEHKNIVQLLIEKGADIHAQGGYYDNALQAASHRGHEYIVELLIKKGADIHAQGGYYGNALQAASAGGHENIIQLLMEKGADIHAQGGFYGNALQAASHGGHEKVIKQLVREGADVNAQGGEYGNALQAASDEGHENIVRLLVNYGAKYVSE